MKGKGLGLEVAEVKTLGDADGEAEEDANGGGLLEGEGADADTDGLLDGEAAEGESDGL